MAQIPSSVSSRPMCWSTIALASAYPEATVVGIDLDGPSIDRARENAKQQGVGDNITFANQVYDKDNKTLLGHDNGWCIRTIAGEMLLCFASRISATRPATCGEAIDVPPIVL